MNRMGVYGENLAVKYLLRNGYIIIERNWYCWAGEIDIVAKKGIIVFLEVKFRNNNYYGYPTESINYRKLGALNRAIQRYLMEKQLTDHPWRFDVLSLEKHGNSVRLKHYMNLNLNCIS